MKGRHFAWLGLAVAASSAHGQKLTQQLDSAMRAAEARGFSGVVRVEKGGALLLEKGYGMANRAERIPFTPETVVQIGSNTKDFTVVALLQLQERGKLTVGDAIAKYFPTAPADKRAITLWQLVTHEAGFPLGLGGDFEPVDRVTLVANAMKAPLLFTPGARESYSNTGYGLLAAVIEHVSGQTYDAYVRDNILRPLGLKRTGFLDPGFRATELAHGYRADGADAGTMLAKPHAADGPYWNLRGNGGMLSTVADMHGFYKALFESETLLKRASRDLRFNADEPIGLAGSDLVNFFLYERDPAARLEMIIASTNADSKAPAIRRELGKLLGIPNPDGPDVPAAPRTGGKPVAAPIAEVINGLIAAVNQGDSAVLRRYIADHFASEPGGPTLAQRLDRFVSMHGTLGALTVVRLEEFSDGIEAAITAGNGDRATMGVDIERTAPYRIRGIRMRVGGH